MTEISFREAFKAAMVEALTDDQRVFLLWQQYRSNN